MACEQWYFVKIPCERLAISPGQSEGVRGSAEGV